MLELSSADARRIALGGQGFGPLPKRVDRSALRRLMDRISVIQIDAVNVLVRSQYLPVYSRLGPYDRRLLDKLAHDHRELYETTAHEAALAPVSLYPLLRPFAREAASVPAGWPMGKLIHNHSKYVERVYRQVAKLGPVRPSDLPAVSLHPDIDPYDARKIALQWLCWNGRMAISDRAGAERVYDLVERVIPEAVSAMPSPPADEARQQLLLRAARALGVATAEDLLDYFRMRPIHGRPALKSLVEDGSLAQVRVEGWAKPAYLYPDAVPLRSEGVRALLTPFDSLIWFRPRTERLFGFHYRIEIYVPPTKRVYGYYVLPFLLGDELVARVDLKSDRKASSLLVQAAYIEPGRKARTVAAELGAELRRLAGWLGLDDIRVGERGDLAQQLRRELMPSRR